MSDWDQQPQNADDMIDQILSSYAHRQNLSNETAEVCGDDLWHNIQSCLEADQAARTNKTVPEFDEGLLCAYADGELTANDPQIEELEKWLVEAPHATRLIHKFSSVSSWVRSYSYRMEAACQIDVTEAVMTRFREEQEALGRHHSTARTRFKKSWIAIPAAAAAVFLFATYAGYSGDPQAAHKTAASPVMDLQEEASLLASAPAQELLDDEKISTHTHFSGTEDKEPVPDALFRTEVSENSGLSQARTNPKAEDSKEESTMVLTDDSFARATGFSVEPDSNPHRSRSTTAVGGFSVELGSTTVFRPDTGMRMASASDGADGQGYRYYPQHPARSDSRRQAESPQPALATQKTVSEGSPQYLAKMPAMADRLDTLEVSRIPSAEEYVLNFCHDELPHETDALGFMYSCVDDVSR